MSSVSLQQQEFPAPINFSEGAAARFIGVSVMTLRRDRRDGRLGIPFIRIGGRVLYPRGPLEKWNADHTRVTSPCAIAGAPVSRAQRGRGRPRKAEQIARARAAEGAV